jgi:hypothetical protein
MSEIWKDAVGHEGFYQVSNLGRVKGVTRQIWVKPSTISPNGHHITVREKILKPTIYKGDRGGFYTRVTLWDHHVARQVGIHVLVCEAFQGARPEGYYCCHKDDDGLNNSNENLYWGTPTQNYADMRNRGRNTCGSKTPWSKLTEADVVQIRKLAGSMTQREIGEKFGVKQPRVSRILSGEQWRHVA